MRAQRIIGLVALLWVLGRPSVASAQITTTVSIPAGVSFVVPDVSQSVSGNPGPFRVVFSTAGMKGSQDFYVSVKADSANFAGPGTTHIPASKVSWTSTPVGRGSGSSGTLSSAAYSPVYQSSNNKSGAFDMTWTLASTAAAGLRSGTHTITVRWRLEAF